LAKDIRDSVAKMAVLSSSKDGQHQLVEKSLREMELRLLAAMKEMVANEVRQALIIHSAR
jgi:hypothetical protein